jgi:hypothetical protein
MIPTIFIVLEGGLVQDVYTDQMPGPNVVVIDLDALDVGEPVEASHQDVQPIESAPEEIRQFCEPEGSQP